jgi:hypothetical protein
MKRQVRETTNVGNRSSPLLGYVSGPASIGIQIAFIPSSKDVGTFS